MSWIAYLIIFIFTLVIVKWKFSGSKTKKSRNLNNQVVIITGSSAGIGRETARSLLSKGATVVFACRNEEKTKTVIEGLCEGNEDMKKRAIFMELDLARFKSVIEFAKALEKRFPHIDILINNAGTGQKYELTEDKNEWNMQVNHLSHALLSILISDLVSKSEDGRIINVGSNAHKFIYGFTPGYFNFDPAITLNIWQSYAISKLGINFNVRIMKRFCEKLNLPIKNICVHPGFVFTDIFYGASRSFWYKIIIGLLSPIFLVFALSEKMGAQTSLHCCYLEREELVDGGYYSDCKLDKEGSLVRDKDVARYYPEFTRKVLMGIEGYDNRNVLQYCDCIYEI